MQTSRNVNIETGGAVSIDVKTQIHLKIIILSIVFKSQYNLNIFFCSHPTFKYK